LPVVWVALEWARVLLAPGHFDLLALGYSQTHCAPLVQIADITGVYGISFLVAAVNGLLADVWFALRGAAWRPRVLLRERGLLLSFAAITAAFALTLGYGEAALSSTRKADGPRLTALRPDATEGGADLFVGPNTEVEDLAGLASQASRKSTAILAFIRSEAGDPAGPSIPSAYLLDAAGLPRGRSDKQLLFPFSEYLPLDRAAGHLAPKVQRAYRWLIRKGCGKQPTGIPGAHRMPLDLPWRGRSVPFAVVFDAEGTYPPIVAEASRRGARFVVNFVSDAEVSGVLREQRLRVCALRAIENRTTFVRAGSSGISGFIDPQGRVRSDPSGTVELSTAGTTTYAISHDAFALLCVGATLWMLARALLRGRPVMTPHPVTAEATAG
jgi:apolipoprotein N-acyltransferase